MARYDDGHGFCHSCHHWDKGDTVDAPTRTYASVARGLITDGEFAPLTKRKITEDTCKKYGYRLGVYSDQPVQIADYYNIEGTEVVAQKVRFANKDFTVLGDLKQAGLYGQHLWGDGIRANSKFNSMIVVTEGEIDCLTVSQQQQNKWPVVSIPNGAAGAVKAIKKQLEWLSTFDTVVLMFDQDKPGKEAAAKCAELFAPGKCKIATLSLKDPNEMLLAGKGGEIINAIWNAKVYRPDGIVAGLDLWDKVSQEDTTACIQYPWQGLNEKTRGIRKGELLTLTAGTGVGKSALCREIAHWLHAQGEKVGYIGLEENVRRTALGIIGISLNRPLHLGREGVSEADLKRAFDATVGSGRFYLYDHFGSTEVDNLLARIRYLARGCDVGWVVLDHLSIVVSGLGDGDERRLIDNAMTMLRTLVEETGIGLILVSHLKRPDGKGHEDGAEVSLSQLRGSQAIAQLSDMVVAIERDQQGDDPMLSTLRVLKNRFSGETGEAGYLRYDRDTGRLTETTKDFGVEAEDGPKDF